MEIFIIYITLLGAGIISGVSLWANIFWRSRHDKREESDQARS
jgi:hypothetical protein